MSDNDEQSLPPIRTHLAQMEREKHQLQSNMNKSADNCNFFANERSQLYRGQRLSSSSTSSTNSTGSSNSNSSVNSAFNSTGTLSPGTFETTEENLMREANKVKDKGNRYVKNNDFDLALKTYTLAIKMHNKDAIFYANRAFVYLKLER